MNYVMKSRLFACVLCSILVGSFLTTAFNANDSAVAMLFVSMALGALGIVVSSAMILIQGDSYDNAPTSPES